MKPFNNWDEKLEVEMNEGDYCFHGDVGIFCKSLPDDFESMPKVTDNILAHGEHTGHCHKLFGDDIDLRECPETKTKHLRLIKPASLKHQEHKEIVLPPGDYTIGIQKEYDHFEEIIRQVQD